MRAPLLLLSLLLAASPAAAASSKTSGGKVRTGVPTLGTGAPTVVPKLSLGLTPTLGTSLNLTGTPSLTATPSVVPNGARLSDPTGSAAKPQLGHLDVSATIALNPFLALPLALEDAGIDRGLASVLAARLSPAEEDAPLLLAKILKSQGMPVERKALLLLALSKPDDSKIQLFSERYGFSAQQVRALSQEPFAYEAFKGEDQKWAMTWGPKLRFVKAAAPYAGTVEAAELRLKELGADRAGVSDGLQKLLDSPEADLLPIQELANLANNAVHFQEVQQKGLAAPKTRGGAKLDEGVVQRAAEEAGALSTPVQSADAEPAKRYIKSVMGARNPTTREIDALLLDYMDMKGIEPNSKRGKDLRASVLPYVVAQEQGKLAGLSPQFRRFEGAILRVSEESGIPVAELEAFLKEWDIWGPSTPEEQVENVLKQYAERKYLEGVVAKYPKTDAGQLMREIASTMLARGGKSVEEIARDGVFVYADFGPDGPRNLSVGRDPDPKAPHMIFYVTRPGEKWKISGYRNNRTVGRADDQLIKSLLKWLEKGGVPSGDFLN